MLELLPRPSSETTSHQVEIRLLNDAEVKSVEWVFRERGHGLPTLPCSFVGAVQDGKVIGFLVAQYRLHVEPMWIESGHSEQFLPLVRATERHILQALGPQWVYLMAPDGKVSKLAEAMGMEMEPMNTFTKLVSVATPDKGLMDEILPIEVTHELRNEQHDQASEQQSGGSVESSPELSVPTAPGSGADAAEYGTTEYPGWLEFLQHAAGRKQAGDDGATPASDRPSEGAESEQPASCDTVDA